MKKTLVTSVAQQVMQLGVLSARFGAIANRSSWAIVRCYNEDGVESLVPAINIGDDLYIDILADEVKCLCNVGGCVSKINDAIVKKTRKGFLFECPQRKYFVDNQTIYNLYKNKFVYKEKMIESKCLN